MNDIQYNEPSMIHTTILTRQCLLLACLVLLGFSQTLRAEEAEVILRDGRVLKGQFLSENSTVIRLRVSNISQTIARADIAKLTRIKTLQEQYEARHKNLKDDDIEGRYRLCVWLREKKAYKLALYELSLLAKKEPDDFRIRLQIRAIKREVKEAEESQHATSKTQRRQTRVTKPYRPNKTSKVNHTNSTKPAKDDTRNSNGSPFKIPTEMLSQAQINTIRAFEVNLNSRPRIRFKRETLNEFLKAYAQDESVPKGTVAQSRFLRAKGWQQLGLMFEVKARDFYDKATFAKDPQMLANFAPIHRRYVLQRCASTQCHGKGAGQWFLFNKKTRETIRGQSQRMMTNYFILQQWQDSKGFMLDPADPENSYLLQYGLKPNDATHPHPPVENARFQYFSGTNDPIYQAVLSWIKTLAMPRSNYGIDYRIAGMKEPYKNAVNEFEIPKESSSEENPRKKDDDIGNLAD